MGSLDTIEAFNAENDSAIDGRSSNGKVFLISRKISAAKSESQPIHRGNVDTQLITSPGNSVLQDIFGKYIDFDDTSDVNIIKRNMCMLIKYLERVDLNDQPGLRWLLETTLAGLERKLAEKYPDVTPLNCKPSFPRPGPRPGVTSFDNQPHPRRRTIHQSRNRQNERYATNAPLANEQRKRLVTNIPQAHTLGDLNDYNTFHQQPNLTFEENKQCVQSFQQLQRYLCAGATTAYCTCLVLWDCLPSCIHTFVLVLQCVAERIPPTLCFLLEVFRKCACQVMCITSSIVWFVYSVINYVLTSLATWTNIAARGWAALPELIALFLEAMVHRLKSEYASRAVPQNCSFGESPGEKNERVSHSEPRRGMSTWEKILNENKPERISTTSSNRYKSLRKILEPCDDCHEKVPPSLVERTS